MLRPMSSMVAGITECDVIVHTSIPTRVCVYVAIVSNTIQCCGVSCACCLTLTQLIDASSLLLRIVVHRVVTHAPHSVISDSRVFKRCRRNATNSSQSISPTASRCPRGHSPPSPKDVLSCRTSFCPVVRALMRIVCWPLPRVVLAWSVSVWSTVT